MPAPDLRGSILTSIRQTPKTIDGIRNYVNANKSKVREVLDFELQYGRVGWFNTSEATIGNTTPGIRTYWGEEHRIGLGYVAGDSVGAYLLPKLIPHGDLRQVELFVARMLRRDAVPGRRYWMYDLQDHIRERTGNKKEDLIRFIIEDLELDLIQIREASRRRHT